MSDIPLEIFIEILLRVPAEPLLRFRAVCKSWRSIIDNPSFVEIHSKNVHSPTTLLIKNSTGGRIYSVSLDSLNLENDTRFSDAEREYLAIFPLHADSKFIKAIPVKTLVRPGVPRVPDFPVASCNGLILISNQRDAKKSWVMWNRLTREFHELPKPDKDLTGSLIGNGFGYDSATNDYKVVRIDEVIGDQGVRVCRTLVYSLKSNSWKIIKDFPLDCWGCGDGVFQNGFLFWNLKDMIIALDLETEDYSNLSLPPPNKIVRPNYMFFEDEGLVCTHLDSFDGCLVYSYCYKDHLDVWVMKDHREQNLWTKLFSTRKGERMFRSFHGRAILKPVAYLKNKGQLLLQHDRRLFWVDIEKNSMIKVRMRGLPKSYRDFSSQTCPGSLFRLDQSYDDRRSVATKRRRRRRSVSSKMRYKRMKIYVNEATDIWYNTDSAVECYSESGWLSLESSGDDFS